MEKVSIFERVRAKLHLRRLKVYSELVALDDQLPTSRALDLKYELREIDKKLNTLYIRKAGL